MSTTDRATRLPPPPGPVFLVGIGGIGMSGLAQMLRRQGYTVAGSDRQLAGPGRDELVADLRAQGIALFPQDGSGVRETRPAVLVASAAVEEGNPDFLAAPGTPCLGRARALAAALERRGTRLLAVAGSCGKTSVTGWLASALRALGRRVEMVCGGYALASVAPGQPGNYDCDPDPEFSVVEVDESDRSLVEFAPDLGILLNVGHDHYGQDELIQVFSRFLGRCTAGVVLPGSLAPVFAASGPPGRATFGPAGEGADVTVGDYSATPAGCRFRLTPGGACASGQLGWHSALNAAAVAAALRQLGLPAEAIPEALAAFPGIAQRFQRLGGGPVPTYCDYAHNPEKIQAALRTAQDAAGGPVLAAFQPHGYGPFGFMRDELREALARTLRPEDRFFLLPVYYAGGTSSFRPTAAEVAAEYAALGLPVQTVEARDDLLAQAKDAAGVRLALVMGARDPSLPAWTAKLAAALYPRQSR